MKPRGRAAPQVPTNIEVTSGFGHNTQSPFVEINLNDARAQMTPLKAREIAAMLLEAADAAESDGFVVTFIQRIGGLDAREAAGVLVEFRTYRDAERKRQAKHDWPETSTG